MFDATRDLQVVIGVFIVIMVVVIVGVMCIEKSSKELQKTREENDE